MGVSLSLECSYAVSRAYRSVRPSLGGQLGGLAGRGRLKAPNIALPGYRNDS